MKPDIGCKEDLFSFVKKQNIKMVDLKFVDLLGRWHHLSIPVERFDERVFSEGLAFDSSSTPGFKSVESGDMVLIPDWRTAWMDPFWEMPTLSFISSVAESDTKNPYKRDPRGIVKSAVEYMKSTGIADESRWGPELEFYIFDKVVYEEDINRSFYMIDSEEADWNSGLKDAPNLGHRIPRHGGYHAIPPLDHLFNLRASMVVEMQKAGIDVRYHHHEVGGPGQSEIEVRHKNTLITGDNVMTAKYIIKMLAKQSGRTATFMPKPLFNEAGNGMHFHQHLFKNGEPLFYEKDAYAGLSETALYYIGGLLEHGRSLLAFTNPSTNSYKRLIPGFEAPTNLFFGLANRSAAIRIPKSAVSPRSKRIEFRPPDATGNIYLALAVQLMAGLDGIKKKINPIERGWGPFDIDVSDIPSEKLINIKPVPVGLKEAIDALKADHDYLLEGGVFSKDVIDTWTEYKMEKEHFAVRNRPHPHEISLYFDV